MTTEHALIICGCILVALILKWYADYRYHESVSEFFNKQADAAHKETTDAEKIADKDLEEYYRKRAEYNALKRELDNDTKREGS